MRLSLVPLVLLACVSLLAPRASDAQVLRYGGDPGRSDRYRLTTTVAIHQDFQGSSTDLTVRSYGVLVLTLEGTTGDSLGFGVVYDSLDLAFEGAPVEKPDLSCVVGRTLRLGLSPTGRVLGFEAPADLCETPPGFDLKQMVSHFFPRLPEAPAREGLEWADTLAYPVSQQGIESQVRVVTHYTARGKNRVDGREFLQVAYVTETTVAGQGEQGGRPLFVDGSGHGEGSILFDQKERTFWRSTGTQTLDLTVDVTPEGQPPLSIPVRQQITSEIQHL
jgi:hypothetical protein